MYTFYSAFNISLCGKLEIQNDLPKITQIKWNCNYLLWSKILNYVDFLIFKQLFNWYL